MMNFSELHIHAQELMLLLMFGTILCELSLLLRQASDKRPLRNMIPGGCILIVLVILQSLWTAIYYRPAEQYFADFPILFALLLVGLTLIHFTVSIILDNRLRKTELRPGVIKQAIDDLPTGVCFADPQGVIILCNRRMGELSESMIGGYPQMLSELEAALEQPQDKSGVQRIEGSTDLYCFPNGKVWRFCISALSRLRSYTQLAAYDVTELYTGNARLIEANEELRCVNVKLKQMQERLGERIREKETLDLKMRIHDEIGSSLIALSEIINDKSEENVETQLNILRNAVSYISNEYLSSPDSKDHLHQYDTFEAAQQKAKQMNVELTLDGYLPQNNVIKSIVIAAINECVTNCIKHAGGKKVQVDIVERSGIYTVTITNDGAAPKGKIEEGGGLSTLRHSVERIGGEMYISHQPIFALILNLNGKEQEL